jgi:DNA topoisomerase-1
MAPDTAEMRAPAEIAGLTYVTDLDPGIRRVTTKDGFGYRDPAGRLIRDKVTLERIRKLAIPPAWTDVWICPDADGHIQAIGRDARRRKQYRYHADWRAVRDADKFDRVIEFGRALPRLRGRVEKDLTRSGLPREKVLGAVVKLMEITLVRVGNDEYAKQNKSFGLTTLRAGHVKFKGAAIAIFEFRGKSGKVHKTGFRDRRLARIVRSCQELPGQRLFQYVGEDGQTHAIGSTEVNAYIREAMGQNFSAKDFRTWAGTLAAARALIMQPERSNTSQAKRHVTTCVKAVAGLLGNTAAVCRGSYIHPRVLDAYQEGSLPLTVGRSERAFELAVLRFLEAARQEATENGGRPQLRVQDPEAVVASR